MAEPIAAEAALRDVRVLDLTGETGVYCTKLLADLGADVIRVEPPGGHPMRRIAPFYHDDPDPETSLHHFFFNTSKRAITLDIEHLDGRDILRQLAARADVLVETFPVGYLGGLGLGYAALAEMNPRLIMTSITPFGQVGPYKRFKGPNIVADALGGLMYVTGSPDGPPLMSGPNQACYLAGEQAAVATLIALYHRDLTGEGQYVDVSMHEAVALAVQPQSMFWPGRGEIPKRFGYGQRTSTAAAVASSFYRCKDGWVTGLGTQGRTWPEMAAWLKSAGAEDDLEDPRYEDPQERIRSAAHIEEVIGRFALAFTMEDLVETGQKYRMFVFPCYGAGDIVNDPHLEDRKFFVNVDHPELGASIKYPGVPYRHSGTPARISRRAPRVGEHNAEVYQQLLGISKERLVALKSLGAI